MRFGFGFVLLLSLFSFVRSLAHLSHQTLLSETKVLTKDMYSNLNAGDSAEDFPTPCRGICTYQASLWQNGTYYPTLLKPVSCREQLHRLGESAAATRLLTHPPKAMFDAFSMFGKVAITIPPKEKFGAVTEINEVWVRQWKRPVCPSRPTYPDVEPLFRTLRKHVSRIQGKTGLVIGSMNPWVECQLLALGAVRIITLEYNRIVSADPRIIPILPQELASQALRGTFPYRLDFVASFSSVEHSGLTRYGDAANPYGDLEAIAQAHCLTTPTATLFLGVPMQLQTDAIEWPFHRIYGYSRLPHLTANWDCFDLMPSLEELASDGSPYTVNILHGVLTCSKV